MKKSLRFIIPLVLAAVIAGLAIYSHLLGKIPANPDGYLGNTAGNLNSGGKFCEAGGRIFLSNPYDMGKLYSMNPDCSDIRKISDDSVSYINGTDKYIYYVRNNSKGGGKGVNVLFRGSLYGIVRCGTDGSREHTLVSGYCTDMTLTGNTLLYKGTQKSVNATYSVNTSGDSKKTVSEKIVTNSCIVDNKIFYSSSENDHCIHSLDIGTGSDSLYIEGNTYMTNIVDGYVYYIDLDNGYALTRINLSDRKKTVISDDRCILYNVYENVIYYQAENPDGHACYRINTDGSGRIEIMSGDISSISCTSQYTFLELFDSQVIMRTPTFGTPAVETFTIDAAGK